MKKYVYLFVYNNHGRIIKVPPQLKLNLNATIKVFIEVIFLKEEKRHPDQSYSHLITTPLSYGI